MVIQQIISTVDNDTTVYLIASNGLFGPIGILRLDPTGFIRSLFVQDVSRGKGVGSALIERACKICQEQGCETVGLSVSDGNPRARQLYRRLGFVKYIEGHEGYTQFIKPLT